MTTRPILTSLAALTFLACSDTSSAIFSPTSEGTPPPKVFTGHPPFQRDTTWAEFQSGMSLRWNVPEPLEKYNNPWNYRIVEDSKEAIRYGWQAERFELRTGDCLLNDCFRPNRNERRERAQNPNEIELDTEYWYGWSLYVPADNPAQDSFLFFGQVQQAPSNEPIWMFVKNGKDPFCMLRSPTVDRSFYCEVGTDFALIDHDQFAGQWHDFVMNVKWSQSDGFVRLWVNGEKKADYVGSTMTPGNEFVSFVYGLYRPTNRATVIVYYDELRWGKTRAEVDLRMLIEKHESSPGD